MDKTKTVAWICIAGFVLVVGMIAFVNRESLFGEKEDKTPAPQE